MYNYNRDVYQAEHERQERMMTAAQRQLPLGMRRNTLQEASDWLGQHVGQPLYRLLAPYSSHVARRTAVYYRRASTRAMGLAASAIEELLGLVPGRA